MQNRIWALIATMLLVLLSLLACQKETVSEEFVFGMVLVGPYNDHGWSQAHYSAGLEIVRQLPGTKMVYLDKLNPADRPETTLEQAVDDMVSQGAKVVFTTSDDFQTDTDLVAGKYPDVTFIMVSGDHANLGLAPSNVGNYMGRMTSMKAAAGCAAILTSQTKTIGYVGPLINDETRRLVASVYLGARHCSDDPDSVRLIVRWIGFWFSIPGVTLDPTEVTHGLLNEGADVIVSGIDTTEALVVTKQRAASGMNVWAIPYDFEGACSEAEDICLGVPYFNWAPGYVEIMKQVQSGTWKQHWTWAGGNAVGWKPGPALRADDRVAVDKFIAHMAAGDIDLFKGPLNFQDGSVYLEDGEVATDAEVWYFTRLLEGIEGASE